MKKNKMLFLSIIFQLVLHSTLLAQTDNQRKLINQLFFDIPSSNGRSDIKAILSSNANFYFPETQRSGPDYTDILFDDHIFLRLLGRSNSLSVFTHPDGTLKEIVISSHYRNEKVKCKDQVAELVGMFDDESSVKYHSEPLIDGNNNSIGWRYTFYSSSDTRKKMRGYLSFSYKRRFNEDYVLDIHFYPDNLN